MKHICGGAIKIFSVEKTDSKIVEITLVCDKCGNSEKHTEYMCDFSIQTPEDSNIGMLARVGDVWYQVMDSRCENGKFEYKLYSRDAWISINHIKKFKSKCDIK